MANSSVSVRKMEDPFFPHNQIDACSLLLHPTHEENYAIQVTGVYIPPSAEATPDMLQLLVEDQHRMRNGQGDLLSHLLVGDFNPNCWRGTPTTSFKSGFSRRGYGN